MSTATTFIVTDGDSKYDLFQQLLIIGLHDDDGKRVAKKFRVKGHLEGLLGDLSTTEEFIQVNGIEAEDGSGESWLIKGYYPAKHYNNGHTSPGGLFEGYYDTRHRTGYLKITFN